MPIYKPYHNTVRQFVDGEYSEGGRSRYVRHPSYARRPSDFIRLFLLIQKDLETLFVYVEPADQNLDTYSFRLYELLLRCCTEVEANFKEIFRANTYRHVGRYDITHYAKIDRSHYLSGYEIKMPYWFGQASRKPFVAWNAGHSLVWYQAYNSIKHDRAQNLKEATLDHVVDAFCGLAALLAAQFYDYDFGPRDDLLSLGGIDDGHETGIGNYVRVKYPNIPLDDRYEFDWPKLEGHPDPFGKFNYDLV
jgi:hypothetical protein